MWHYFPTTSHKIFGSWGWEWLQRQLGVVTWWLKNCWDSDINDGDIQVLSSFLTLEWRRDYDSEISICLNVCCKNWMFFFFLLEPLYIYNLSISHLIHFIITSYFIFFLWPQEDSQVILKPISISEHSQEIHKWFLNGHY